MPATANYPAGGLRVSDAERDHAVSQLSEAYRAGRITSEELGERTGQALRARTGGELAGLLADLPHDRAPQARPACPARTRVAAGAGMVASAVTAASLTVVAVSNALATGPSLAQREAQRELAQQVLSARGISVRVPLPPAQGFDWAGTLTPAVFAALLVALVFVLRAAVPARRAGTASR